MKKFLFLAIILSCSLWAKETFILTLHSYHETYPWTIDQRKGFKEAIDTEPGLFTLYSTEYLDTKRRTLDQAYEDELVHYMREKYKGYCPDIIYVTDDNALKFMIDNKEKLFPGVPVVFSGINNQAMIDTLPKDSYTGIHEKKEIIPNLQLIQKLFPKEHEVLLVGDGSSTANAVQIDIQRDKSTISSMDVRCTNNQNLDLVIGELKAYKGKNIILITVGGFLHPHNGNLVPLSEAVHEIVHAGDFHVFSTEDTFIQQGVIGGHASNGIFQGKEAGKLALQIISHPNAPLPERIKETNKWIFDIQALKQHNIMLPDAIASQSTFINRPTTFYQKNEDLISSLIYGLLATILLGSLTFIWYLYRSRKIISEREHELAVLSTSLNKAQELSHLGNWVWDIKANILWWSDEIYRIFGLLPKEFKATSEGFLERVHPDDRETVQEAINHALTHHTNYNIIHRIVQIDGAVRHVHEEGQIEYLDGEPHKMTGTVQDITDDFEKEEALLLQAQIFDAVQDSIIVHDLEGHFIYLNENAWKTRGYTQEEMMGMTVKELDAPQYDSGHPEMIKEAMKKMEEEGHINIQVEHLCKNGEHMPVEVYAKLITLKDKPYILSSIRDISEQKKTQKALLASEKKYRDLVEDMMIGIYRTDLFGNIFYVNPALAKMLAFDTTDELTEQNALKMYKSTRQRKTFIRALLKEGHINNYELEVLNKHGVPVPVMMTATLDGDIFTGMMVDMSEIKRSRREIDTLSKVVEQIDDSVIITDKRGVITYVNQAFCDHTGFSKKEVLGKNPKLLKSSVQNDTFYENLWKTISSGEVFRKTLVNKKKNNDFYYENKTITPLKNDENDIIGYVSTGKDVTSETLMHKEMENIATFDKLTGIYNRYKFEELYELESERSQRFSQPLSLILIDIDHFKLVNDTYGHTVGDEVLKKLADVIKNNIRKIDIFARWGGEEFLVLSPSTDLGNIQILAEKLRLAVESASFPGVDHLTISLGVSIFKNNDTFSELFKRVDQGLYYAKEHGRNQVGIVSTL